MKSLDTTLLKAQSSMAYVTCHMMAGSHNIHMMNNNHDSHMMGCQNNRRQIGVHGQKKLALDRVAVKEIAPIVNLFTSLNKVILKPRAQAKIHKRGLYLSHIFQIIPDFQYLFSGLLNF